jgi:hypothetical protein
VGDSGVTDRGAVRTDKTLLSSCPL